MTCMNKPNIFLLDYHFFQEQSKPLLPRLFSESLLDILSSSRFSQPVRSPEAQTVSVMSPSNMVAFVRHRLRRFISLTHDVPVHLRRGFGALFVCPNGLCCIGYSNVLDRFLRYKPSPTRKGPARSTLVSFWKLKTRPVLSIISVPSGRRISIKKGIAVLIAGTLQAMTSLTRSHANERRRGVSEKRGSNPLSAPSDPRRQGKELPMFSCANAAIYL